MSESNGTATRLTPSVRTRRARHYAAGLIAIALVLAGLRVYLTADAERELAWALTIDITFDAQLKGATLLLHPPWNGSNSRVVGERLAYEGLRLPRLKPVASRGQIRAVAREPGEYRLRAQFDIYIDADTPRRLPIARLDSARREALLESNDEFPAHEVAIQSLVTNLPRDPGPMLSALYARVATVKRTATGANDVLAVLATGAGSSLGRHRLLVTLARAAGMPARLVTGVRLLGTGPTTPEHWAEVHMEDQWHPVDLAHGRAGTLRPTSVALHRGGTRFVAAEHGSILAAHLNVSRAAVPAAVASERAEPWRVLDLTRLPPAAAQATTLLLVLPLGVLLTALLHNLVGIRTYGTFTPTLLGLAALVVDLIPALVVFAVVIVVALGGRMLLPQLNLQRTPRLSVVFILVALALGLSISILDFRAITAGGEVLLIPVVVLTTLVDRVYTVADERGLRVALQRLGWTGVVAALTMPLLASPALGPWLLQFPEAHLATIAVILLAARYRGRTLSQVPGWTWIGEPAPANQTEVKTTADGA